MMIRLNLCLKIIVNPFSCCGRGRKGITLPLRSRIEYKLEIRQIGSRNFSMSDSPIASGLFGDDLAQEGAECIASLNAHFLGRIPTGEFGELRSSTELVRKDRRRPIFRHCDFTERVLQA